MYIPNARIDIKTNHWVGGDWYHLSVVFEMTLIAAFRFAIHGIAAIFEHSVA